MEIGDIYIQINPCNMTKYKTKKRINLTIDAKIYDEFIVESRLKSLNKSAYVENIMRAWLKENVLKDEK